LPAGIAASAAIRFGGAPALGLPPAAVLEAAGSLALTAPCGLPLALGCRRLWRRGRVFAAWAAATVLGAATVAASVPAGLLGPLAVAATALLLSLPVWIAAFLPGRRDPKSGASGRKPCPRG